MAHDHAVIMLHTGMWLSRSRFAFQPPLEPPRWGATCEKKEYGKKKERTDEKLARLDRIDSTSFSSSTDPPLSPNSVGVCVYVCVYRKREPF